MHVQGKYPYQWNFADRPIESPIAWQRWITDAPGEGSGGGGEGEDEDEDKYEYGGMDDYGMGDGEGRADTGTPDLSKTVVLERPPPTLLVNGNTMPPVQNSNFS
jgi:hypothetical protein